MDQLSPVQTGRVLAYLGVEPGAPDLALLDRLVLQYARKVSWESASRIARRAQHGATICPPRLSDEFWDSAIRLGTGGTCFESNWAFFALLTTLGYEGYLTINNMQETVGCHTAIILRLEGQRWLVDAGYPIYAPLPLDPAQPTGRTTPYMRYTVDPVAPGRYVIMNMPHPKPYMFDLLDRPVDAQRYVQAMSADYGPGGFFLNRVVIHRVVDGTIRRFNSAVQPLLIEAFQDGNRSEDQIAGDPAAELSRCFGMSETIIAAALAALETV